MVTIVTRAQWGARAPKHIHRIPTPTPELYLHHSASSGTDETAVRRIQDFHMDTRDWSDIAYSYLLDDDAPDVDIFEGRGAGIAGGHTAGRNTISHAICIIGNYTTKPPTALTLRRVAELVAYGHGKGWWPLGFTGGHRDAPGAATTCPGDALHRLIPDINAEARRIHNQEDDNMPLSKADIDAVAAAVWDRRIAKLDQTAPNPRPLAEHMLRLIHAAGIATTATSRAILAAVEKVPGVDTAALAAAIADELDVDLSKLPTKTAKAVLDEFARRTTD